jgi:ribosomal protein S18 acetylase RimI-like enzyme
VCDVVEPWAHGTVLRATRYPGYFDLNFVRVEDDPAMSAEALIAFSDEALAGLAHRRLDFDLIGAAEPLRAGFEARGWRTERLVWMRHEATAPSAPDHSVEEVPYDAVRDLRLAWSREDFPDQDPSAYLDGAREIALRRGAKVLAVREARIPVGFAQLEREGAIAEITHVYVHPDHRRRGRGTALTRAAINAARDVNDLWIVADDEGQAKNVYAQLGFRATWRRMECLRLPLSRLAVRSR